MVNPQLQISAQANFIADTLFEWIQPIGGNCQVVHSLDDLWMQSSQSSQKLIIFVLCTGEVPWSSNVNIAALTHRVSRDWIVRVKRGRGLSAVRGDTISKTVGNAAPFTDFIEQTRDRIRAMLGISEDFGNNYKGWKMVKIGNDTIDCADISFATKNDLCSILMTPDDSQNP